MSTFGDSPAEQLEYVILSGLIPKLVINDNNCWFLNRKLSRNKYKRITVNGKHIQAHAFVASLFLNYKIGSNVCVCHKCDVKACINPNHLFVGTLEDNIRDYFRKRNIKTVKEKLELSYMDIDSGARTAVEYSDIVYDINDPLTFEEEDLC